MSELVAQKTQQLADRQGVSFSPEQQELIRTQLCRGATKDELQMFLWQCKRTGLDPFARQIFAVKRWDTQAQREVMAVQVSIDGFRLIAQRTGKYAGQLGPFWCGDDGVWKDVWLSDNPPVAAKVGILHADFKEPLWQVAKFASFVQKKKDGTPNNFWKNLPEVMIAKVAESGALRRAFPNELSGLYSEEEVDQQNNDHPRNRVERDVGPADLSSQNESGRSEPSQRQEDYQGEPDAPAPLTPVVEEPASTATASGGATSQRTISEAQIKRLYAIFRARGWTKDEVKFVSLEMFQKGSSTELNRDEYDRLIFTIETTTFADWEKSYGK